MSHFTLLVALPANTEDVQAELEKRLAPFDENMRVAPYRSYEEGAAEDHWTVRAYRRGPSTTSYGPFGETVTWAEVVEKYNLTFGHGPQTIALPDDTEDVDSERLYFDEESGRAYSMSTYNPQSKWDWWSIGGRWKGYFRMKALDASVIQGEPVTFEEKARDASEGMRADGAPKGLIDLEGMRGEAAAKAHARYDKWETLSADLPAAKGWSHFTGLVDAGALRIDQARVAYHAQPVVQAAKRTEEFSWGCPIDEFVWSREEYVQRARDGAVPGYAFLDLEGTWNAPGQMGWFGMSSDTPGTQDTYRAEVNRYVDEKLTDADILVCLDLHI